MMIFKTVLRNSTIPVINSHSGMYESHERPQS